MSDRFWVGGGASTNWNATGNTNWSTTSGGANNASVPGTGDLAIFDSNSGVGNSVISANITVQGLDCTGGTGDYAGTITHSSGVTLTINTGAANSLRFSSGMTYTPAAASSLVTLTHTSGTANITSNGKRFFALTINGAGGTTQLLDALRVDFGASAILTVTSGIFDAYNGAGGPFAITAGIIKGDGAVTRSVIFGGTVTIGGNVPNNTTIWQFATTTGLTYTKNSANMVVAAPTTPITAGGWNWSSIAPASTYNNFTLNANSTTSLFIFAGSGYSFANLAISSGWYISLAASQTFTIANAFTWAGTQNNPITIIGGLGLSTTQAIISVASGACSLTWGTLVGVTGSGGATFTATNTLNGGQATGWSITPPADATTAVPTVAQIATAVWQDTTAGDFTLANSVGKSVMNGVALGTGLTINAYTGNTAQTGDAFARLGAPAGASVSADVAAVKVDSAAILVDTGTTLDGNITAIKTKTDQLVFTVANQVDSNALTGGGGGGLDAAGIRAAVGLASANLDTQLDALPTNAELATALGTADDAVLAQVALVKAKTDNLPADPADASDVAAGIAAIAAQLPAALTGAGNLKVDVLAVNGSTNSSAALARGTLATVLGTVGSASTTTSIVTSALDPAAAVIDQFKGRIVIFDRATTTANLRGQATDITASTALGVLTITALTDAPVSGDTFTIT